MDIAALAKNVMTEAKACGLTLVTAESCTAGRLAAALSDAPGAADYFHGGFVTYTKDMKTRVLGVDAGLLREKGAVCAEVAEAMAQAALTKSPADVAVSVTGVAGPEPDEDGNPVGLIFCATARRDEPQRPAARLQCRDTAKDAVLDAAMHQALAMLSEACRAGRRRTA
jgi:nicotinamide-nucleotide amidase